MKLEPVEVSVVGVIDKMMYGVRIKDAPDQVLAEMKQHAKSIGGTVIVTNIWFENESARTLFLLRWQ